MVSAKFHVSNEINKQAALRFFNKDENGEARERVKLIGKGNKWFVVDFIPFHYGKLDPSSKSNVIRKAIELTEQHGSVNFQGYMKAIYSPIYNTNTNTKESKNKEKEVSCPLEEWFEQLWAKYPNKDGKRHAKRHFCNSVRTPEDYARISKALNNYLASNRVKEGFVKNGSTWFHNWQDWENYKDEKKKTAKETVEEIYDNAS